MKPAIPKGTRDFAPYEMVKRNFIINTITNTYRHYGYRQIETPAMENLSTLEGKYGEEGDKLLFRILNSGLKPEDLKNSDSINAITEKGLRYDLTVPFARYVVMHQNEITFPFKRYQVQPVWRADRPQKGRYREFIQCDADVIGSNSLLNEVEMVMMIKDVFQKLGLGVTIKINNRKVLAGICEAIGVPDKMMNITIAIDKLDKTGWHKVKEELLSKGISPSAILKLEPILQFQSDSISALSFLKNQLSASETGLKGIHEIQSVFDSLSAVNFHFQTIQFDHTLARGLNYYTGAIFEVKVNHPGSNFSGSLLGGGRYDDLTGIFGLPHVSGVGISFGIDRIYDVMDELKLFESINLQATSTQVLFVNFGEEEVKYILPVLQQLRAASINAELYPDAVKLKKQISYADSNKIPFVVIAGTNEITNNQLTIKLMDQGKQETISSGKLIERLKTENIVKQK